MPSLVRLLRCLGRAVVKNGGKALCSLVPFGEVAFEIAAAAFEEYRKDHGTAELRADLERLAQAPRDEVHQAAEQAAAAEAAGQPAEISLALVSYLDQVPAAVRRSLRRPDDPAGATLPAGLALSRPEELLTFLPTDLPRFRPGDRPLAADWELVELLGKGGFGEVWKARHLTRSSQKPVALKFCLDPEAAHSLRNEVVLHDLLDRVRQQGQGQGFVPLLETYLRGEPPCLMYEYIEGGDLAALIQELHPQGKLTPTLATRLLHRLASIVAFAHRLSPPLVHRDLKPANVLVSRLSGPAGQARGLSYELFVADFGIGGLAAGQALREKSNQPTLLRHTVPAAVRGAYTPLYASPQQARGEPPDPRDDVHALGVIWYQLLTGDLTLTAIPPDWQDVVAERGLGEEQVRLLAACLASRADRRLASAAELADRLAGLLDAPPPARPAPSRADSREIFTGARRTYTVRSLLAVGDVADVHLGSARSDPVNPTPSDYVLKVSRLPRGHARQENEPRARVHLLTRASDTTYGRYLPTLAESFPLDDGFPRRVNVFLHEPGLYTLEQVHDQHPALDPRHLAWIFKRLLTVLGFCHAQGTIHGAVLPCHVLLHAGNHGLQLVGWGQSVALGRPITHLSPRYCDWYPREVVENRPAVPATDIFLAARCLVYLAGGDPLGERMPGTVPEAIQRFVATCLLEGARMRPDDAWKLHDEFDDLLRRLYGPPRFHELKMS